MVIERQARGYRGPLLRLQAEILMRQEPLPADAAEERLREALALATELGMRPEIAQCRLSLGASAPPDPRRRGRRRAPSRGPRPLSRARRHLLGGARGGPGQRAW